MNDLPVGRSVDETLRLVQAFQYTDKHGEGTEWPAFFKLFFMHMLTYVKRFFFLILYAYIHLIKIY